MKKNNIILIIIIVILIGVMIYFLPNIYKFTSSLSNKKVNGNVTKEETKEELEKITLKSDVLKDLVYPITRVNIYSTDTYYSRDSFTISDMSNNDILATAFTQIYTGYFKNHDNSGCSKNSKSFDVRYMDARIKNTLGNNIKYNYTDFNIYSDTDYVGTWTYDSYSNSYVYNGNCTNNGNIRYYDLKKITKVDASDNNQTLELYFKVAFAKVENDNYTIYSDVLLTEVLDTGKFTDIDSLNEKLTNLNTNSYKYTFKQGMCSYDAYCMEKGEWINE